MKKESQVIIIPTDKASCIHRNKVKTDSGYEYRLTYHETPSKCKNDGLLSGNQHLYITTDEEIKEGDWYIDDANQVRQAVTSDLEYWETRKEYKKIIATTDKSLIIETWYDSIDLGKQPRYVNLPSIQQSFIEAYCKNPVDKVMIEYTLPDKIKNALIMGNLSRAQDSDYILKVDSHNEIIISVIEERLYDRDEMWQCVAQSHITRKDMKNPFDELPEWFDKWVKETL